MTRILFRQNLQNSSYPVHFDEPIKPKKLRHDVQNRHNDTDPFSLKLNIFFEEGNSQKSSTVKDFLTVRLIKSSSYPVHFVHPVKIYSASVA